MQKDSYIFPTKDISLFFICNMTFKFLCNVNDIVNNEQPVPGDIS